ncbi:NUDIX hydrolase [Heyndrickxia ginsengihumi]|uniref:DNA mismatch repair protein MutT n=1 Tax=Heyndrickxia ginsengihumi TaxID=363870 RepID=A0A0A6XVF3_9BACI|nr:NUDIX hydrolase [Heyndrickxia ginsengihumi]KHD84172.1 DNA mismatch repair protein MutT [Heyndrickxia ginsengihumi]MBE6184195.1 NUDIX domain-containing protein [Bacillus sp. (in: firmicutes)]MCM3023436.1 NUDIX hydrolase [Heyndrickxia ginsengihumi]NEY20295.1 NUDIX hydrolase [Heyndrickxia ginsengihumi]
MGYMEELRKIVGQRPLILVGSVVLIINEHDQVLLQQRTNPYGVWGLPGGLMELGESTEETAKREVFEETGLHVNDLSLINIYSGKEYFVQLNNGDQFYSVSAAYWTKTFTGTITVNKNEALNLQFFSFDHLPDRLVKSHFKMINDYMLKH